jgi:hypothetical protein
VSGLRGRIDDKGQCSVAEMSLGQKTNNDVVGASGARALLSKHVEAWMSP